MDQGPVPGIIPEKLCVQVLASVEHAAPATPTPLVFLQWQSQVHAFLAIDTSGKAYSITCQQPSSDAATQAATVSAWVVQLIWDAQTCPGTPAAQTRWSARCLSRIRSLAAPIDLTQSPASASVTCSTGK